MSDLLIIGGFTALFILITYYYVSGTSSLVKVNKNVLKETSELVFPDVDDITKKLIRFIAIILLYLLIHTTLYFIFFF